MVASYGNDQFALDIIAQTSIDSSGPSIWHFSSGVLRRKGKIYIGATGNLREQLVEKFHCSTLGGQLGTLKRLSLLFYWPGMKMMVVQFVASCDVCQRNKDENLPNPGLLQPLPIPNQAWSHISMDFIERLTKSK